MTTPGYDEYYSPRKWLSISSLVSYARCPRKYFYGSGCRLAEPVEHTALTFGETLHAVIPLTLTHSLEYATTKFIELWNQVGAPDDANRNTSVAVEMLTAYYNAHQPGRSLYSILPVPGNLPQIQDRVSAFEIPFALDIGLSIPLVGRIDAHCRLNDGSVWGLEFKTSRELSVRFLSAFELSPQIVCYTLALRTYGISAKGVVVEGLRTSLKNAEALAQPIYVQDHHIEDFLIWARTMGMQLLYDEQRKTFDKYYTGCNPYSQFGMPGYNCDYIQLCTIPDWTSMSQFYIVKDDRPFILADQTPVQVPVQVQVSKKVM